MENPVTKQEGMLRLMQKKLDKAGNAEEKEKLQQQMKSVKQANVMDAFNSYSAQKQVQYQQMQVMA